MNNAMSSFWLTSARASAVLQQEKGNVMKYIWVAAMRLHHPQALGEVKAVLIWASAAAVANRLSPYTILRLHAGSWKMVLPDVSCGWTLTVISMAVARANALMQAQHWVAVGNLDVLGLQASCSHQAQLQVGAVCGGWILLLPQRACYLLFPAVFVMVSPASGENTNFCKLSVKEELQHFWGHRRNGHASPLCCFVLWLWFAGEVRF